MRKEKTEDEGRIRTRCYEKSAFVTKFRDHPTSSRAHSCIFIGEGKLAGRRTLNELVVKCLRNFSQRPSTSSLSIRDRTTGRGALFFSPSRYSFDEESRAGIIDGAFAGIAAFVQQFFRTKRSRIEMFDHRLVCRFVGEVCRRGVEEEMIESVNKT